MCFLCFYSSCFVSYFIFILHLLLAITIVVVCCAMSFHALHYNYLAWCIVPCFALVLFGLVCHPCLAFLLLVVVFHLSLCIVIVCCDALLLFCTTIFVVLHPSPCANAAYYGALSLALCCYYLLWCVVPHFTLLFIVVCHLCLILLLLFTMVCHPSPCPTTTYCGASPSPYAIVVHCGLSFLTLCCCFIIPCLF
jgi:hypothetical protein